MTEVGDIGWRRALSWESEPVCVLRSAGGLLCFSRVPWRRADISRRRTPARRCRSVRGPEAQSLGQAPGGVGLCPTLPLAWKVGIRGEGCHQCRLILEIFLAP